ncbi:hypothetical protein [Mycobacterium sp. TY815]|uniref:hypothetical protein n=1 Tax=Mycobacterium sp. TY815 TaxID=3050581 RepID=UPI003532304E
MDATFRTRRCHPENFVGGVAAAWNVGLAAPRGGAQSLGHLGASTYKMPGGVPMCWAVLGFFAFVIWAFTQKADTLHALQCTPVWFVVLAIVWSVVRKRPHHLQKETVFEAELESDEPMASA